MTDNIPFGVWLDKQYEEFVARGLGQGKGVLKRQDFALWLGITENNLSQYVNGKRKPSMEQASLMARRLGMEVYDRLDLPRSLPKDRLLLWVIDHWPKDEAKKREIIEHMKNRIDERLAKEAEELLNSNDTQRG